VGAGTAALFVRLDSAASFLSSVLNHQIVIVCYPGREEGFPRKYSAGEVLHYRVHSFGSLLKPIISGVTDSTLAWELL
jgi:hypothetical protein